MNLYIKWDWTGDPPGEFMVIATALAFFRENAFFIISSWPAKSIPCLNLPAFPITPFNLICATIFFFLKTTQNILGKIKDVYIPILSYSASIIFDDFHFVKINSSSLEINPLFLDILTNESDLERHVISKELFSILSNDGLIDMCNVMRFEKYLQSNFPQLSSNSLSNYPELTSPRGIKNMSGNSIINAGCFYIKGKSKNTQTVIQELEKLKGNEHYSKP